LAAHFSSPGSGFVFPIWIRIHKIQTNTDPDLDPGCQINTDPYGSGSKALIEMASDADPGCLSWIQIFPIPDLESWIQPKKRRENYFLKSVQISSDKVLTL
jgi:hypothetical protein